jgi:hypothetical protein
MLLFDLVVQTALTAVLAFFGTLVVVDGDISTVCNYLSLPPFLVPDFRVPKPISGIAFIGSSVAFKAYYLDISIVHPQFVSTSHWSQEDISNATPSISTMDGPLPSFGPTPCLVTSKNGALYNFVVTHTLKRDIALYVHNLVTILARQLYQILGVAFNGIPMFVRSAKFIAHIAGRLWSRRMDISLTLAVGDWVWRLQGVPLLLALLVVRTLAGKVISPLQFNIYIAYFFL